MGLNESPLSETARVQAAEMEDRRKWSRISDETGSKVQFSTETLKDQEGQLVDVAVGGFAIKVNHPRDLRPGQQASVRFPEGTVWGVVRYVRADSDRTYRVGMEWVQPKSTTVIMVLRRCLES